MGVAIFPRDVGQYWLRMDDIVNNNIGECGIPLRVFPVETVRADFLESSEGFLLLPGRQIREAEKQVRFRAAGKIWVRLDAFAN